MSLQMKTFQLPRLSKSQSDFVLHVLSVFVAAFGTALVGGATHVTNWSTAVSVIFAAAAAGVAAVGHVIANLVPTPPTPVIAAAIGISVKVKTRFYQAVQSVVILFLSIFGAALVSGAAHIGSLPDLKALLGAAIAAAVAGVVQYVIGLVPAPA